MQALKPVGSRRRTLAAIFLRIGISDGATRKYGGGGGRKRDSCRSTRPCHGGLPITARLPGESPKRLTLPVPNSHSPFKAPHSKKEFVPLAQELGAHIVGHCDVTDPNSIDTVFAEVGRIWGRLDFLVHCIAFSDKDQLTGRYIDTTEDNFTKSLLVSCYSFTAVAQRAEKLMTDGGSLLTLTYYGAEKWMPHYNVMGIAKAALEASVRYLAADLGERNIRVNAISAGPIKTLAASGIGDFRYILRWNEYNAPLRRTVSIEEVGDTGVYLVSPMSRGVTGEIVHVDAGYHIVGMKNPLAPDIAAVRE